MKEQHHEAATELKWLLLINKIIFEEMSKTGASQVTYKL
jgi:hypothetical protein